ncbi:peptide deformylase [Buchnera aphidicola]|uniref:peptide deformylase n=1 Tax=Buchnera aphidicola TaxID=9 RepID=UPI00094C3090|nr:peptide deformylase [Buchnera aphidicola]
MSIKKILQFPDNRLRKIAKPVKKIGKITKKIIRDMFDTMYANHGIGLAATQINIHQQIIVIKKKIQDNKALILINPTILKSSGKIRISESCLSVPNIEKKVNRSYKIQVAAINCNGKKIFLKAKSLLAICIQHEIDHLIGKLFIDHII